MDSWRYKHRVARPSPTYLLAGQAFCMTMIEPAQAVVNHTMVTIGNGEIVTGQMGKKPNWLQLFYHAGTALCFYEAKNSQVNLLSGKQSI